MSESSGMLGYRIAAWNSRSRDVLILVVCFLFGVFVDALIWSRL
jgi:hypothetical protein